MQRNIWHPITDYPDILVGQYVVPNFVSNSVAIRLSDNEYILYSPGKSLLESWPLVNSDDLKLHILMPNAYHYLGVKAWQKQFPNTKLYASDLALKQLIKKKVFSNKATIHSVADLKLLLPNDMDITEPAGHRAGDIWLIKHNQNKTSLWITCDSFLNYDRVSNQPVARFMQKLLGAAPGLKMSQVVKWFILDDRKDFKKWLIKRIAIDNPVALIPSHGEVLISDDLSIRLSGLLKKRL
mgnify:CR=1 FL=1|tara:strand:+ start:11885 stop:12601 length:717 start_codon:yes stop_codon:yes gene_type:complete